MKKIIKKGLLFSSCIIMLMTPFSVNAAKSSVRGVKVTLKAVNTVKGVRLSWNKTKAKAFTVQRKSGSKFKTIKKLNGKYSYTDKNVKSGTKYSYRVLANASASNTKKIIRLSQPVIKHIGAGDLEGMTINWEKVKGAKKYEIYKSEIKGKKASYKKIGTSGNNYFSFNEKSGQPSNYKIRAVNGSYKSALSKLQKYTHMERVNLNTAINSEYDGISVTWDSVKGASEYYLYKAAGESEDFKQVAVITKINTAYTESGLKINYCEYEDKDVTDGETYKYYVTYKAGDNISKEDNTSIIIYKPYDKILNLNVGDTDESLLDFTFDGDFGTLISVKSSDEGVVYVEKTDDKKAIINAVSHGEAYIDVVYSTEYNEGYQIRYKIQVE